jgi:hypothetical protein
MVARWRSAATASSFIWGAAYEQDHLVWKAIADGEIEFVDNAGTPNVVPLTGLDFSAITAKEQVKDVITTALGALVAPTITGLENATIIYDNQDRFYLQMPATEAGAAKATVTMRAVSAAPSGTDLAPLMDTANGTSLAPADAETLVQALEAITEIYPAWYLVRPEADVTTYSADLQAVAQYVQTNQKVCHIVSDDLNAKNPAINTDLGSVLKGLAYNRTMVYYTEKDEKIQAANAGRCLPVPAGKIAWSWNALIGVSHSGATNELGPTATTTLVDKGYNILESYSVGNIIYPGLMADGEEMRIIIGRDWFVGSIQNAMAVDQVNNDLMAFDNPTIAIARKNISTYGREAIARRILVNTPDRPWTITLPDEDDFTSAERNSHKMEITEAFKGYINSAVNDWLIIGTWTI